MLWDLGFEVIGLDQKVYLFMSIFLEYKGICVMDGFKEENIVYCLDLVVIGNVVIWDNLEVGMVQWMGLLFCFMFQVLNYFVVNGKKMLLVSGIYGKIIILFILVWMLYEVGYDFIFMIGGILKNFNSNYWFGSGFYFVVEGDEYDMVFFDKVFKFYYYCLQVVVLISVEFDYVDIF